jgi:hypothetical protein
MMCLVLVYPGERECERSALVNEEIVYFIFQLELDAQLQRALNYEAYEAAQQIRAKRETVRGKGLHCFVTATVKHVFFAGKQAVVCLMLAERQVLTL